MVGIGLYLRIMALFLEGFLGFLQLYHLLCKGEVFHLRFYFSQAQNGSSVTLLGVAPASNLTIPSFHGGVETFHDVRGSQTGP